MMDNYSEWERHQLEDDRWLESRPVCEMCGEPIQEEKCYDAKTLSLFAEELTLNDEAGDIYEKTCAGGAVCENCFDKARLTLLDAYEEKLEYDCNSDTDDYIGIDDF